MTAIGHTRLVRRMVAAGHQVVAATSLYVAKAEAERATGATVEQFSPFYVDRFSRFRELKYMAWSFLFVFKYFSLWLKYRHFDVICLRNAFVGWCIPLVRWAFGARCVISITDIMSGFLYWNSAYPRWLVDAMWKTEIWIISRFDQIFCITEEMKQTLVAQGIPAGKIFISGDGVDTNLFNVSKLRKNEISATEQEIGVPHPRVLFYGNLHKEVVDYFLAIVDETVKLRPDVHFVVIGKGDAHDQLKSKAGTRPLVHLGYKQHDRLAPYIYGCDAGMIPYLHSQNSDVILTLKLLEYGAIGLPIVSTPLKAVYRLFNDMPWIRFEDDAVAFARGLSEMLDRPRDAEQACYFHENYDWDAIMDHVVKEIEKDYENSHR
jgi:glycosyltransferase involved in cell wall biosynthesis